MIPERPLAEVTLRKYEKPFRLSGRELIKKLCLSIGVLQPGDSRDVIVDVFHALTQAKGPIGSSELEESIRRNRKNHNLSDAGCAGSNIRRQVRRLKELFFVEKIAGKYRLTENAPLHEVFTERIEKFYVPGILARIKEYCAAVEAQRCTDERKEKG